MSPGRRFEAIVLGPDALALAPTDRERVVALCEVACANGIHVAIVAGTAAPTERLRPPPGCPASLSVVEPTPSVDAARRLCLEDLWRRGIARGQVLVWPDGGTGLREALDEQISLRERREPPRPDPDPTWTLGIEGIDTALERVHESLLTLADGAIGTRGSAIGAHAASAPAVFAAGLYRGRGSRSELLRAPLWNQLLIEVGDGRRLRRTLDLHGGVLYQQLPGDEGQEVVAVAMFSSLARPGTVALHAKAPSEVWTAARALTGADRYAELGRDGESEWVRVRGDPGGLAVAARQTELDRDGLRTLDRIGVYCGAPRRDPAKKAALRGLAEAEEAGFDALLNEHRSAWGWRWERADVRIDGDPELQLAVRLALFHLMASVGERGEAALGARGLSGPGYRGHVFWDACVYVLPFLAATDPPAARAMLEYRANRLRAARREARKVGRRGARFPWESAAEGSDVTPRRVRTRAGEEVAIRTGELEEHIVAGVAWGTACYLEWSGDEEFRRGSGARLLTETARYWASRIERDADGRGHIRGVIGPDEYHVAVDDNAYTNVMARWNLRYAAGLEAGGAGEGERRRWHELADCVVDGYDAATGLYEQFAGFFDLEPLVIDDLAPSRPIAADLLLGRERVAAAQVVKQADVLMLHHLVPEEVAPGSLVPNLAFYEPRTAHASSLSAGVHASLFARAGEAEAACDALRLAARIDLNDLSGTTAGGLHVAAMGSVWQALAFGFAGLRSQDGVLRVDPRLPGHWERLELRLRHRGVAASVRLDADGGEVASERPIPVARPGEEPVLTGGDWRGLRLGPGGGRE